MTQDANNVNEMGTDSQGLNKKCFYWLEIKSNISCVKIPNFMQLKVKFLVGYSIYKGKIQIKHNI